MPYDDRQLDDLLDRGLRGYAQVEPRDGLEGRILANLQAQPAQQRRWWIWVPALAGAMALLLLAWTLRPHQEAGARAPAPTQSAAQRNGTSPATIATANPAPAPVAQNAATVASALTHSPAGRTPRRRTRVAPTEEVATALPRMDTFPAPAPLSEEERLLLSFYRSNRNEAVETAHAQSAERARVEKYFTTGEPPSAPPEAPQD